MKIKITFMNGSQYWKDLVTRNAEKAQAILSDPGFIEKVRSWHGFDFTKDTPGMVAARIEAAKTVNVKIGFYRGWFWSKAIAYEEGGAIYFNVRKEHVGAGSIGNIAHEVMHAPPFDYFHNGNSASGNENTVPYRVGAWAQDWKLTPAQECGVEAVEVESVT